MASTQQPKLDFTSKPRRSKTLGERVRSVLKGVRSLFKKAEFRKRRSSLDISKPFSDVSRRESSEAYKKIDPDSVLPESTKQVSVPKEQLTRKDFEKAISDKAREGRTEFALTVAREHAQLAEHVQEVRSIVSDFKDEWNEYKLVHTASKQNKDIKGDPLRRIVTKLSNLKDLPEHVRQSLTTTPEDLLERSIGDKNLQAFGTPGTAKQSTTPLGKLKQDMTTVTTELEILIEELKTLDKAGKLT